jgi:hypothetical protein
MPLLDIHGKPVHVGDRVRVLSLSGKWLDNLASAEKNDVLSMIGEIFEVEEIDEYGQAWVRKLWPDEAEGTCLSHSVALKQDQIEVIADDAL